MRYVFAAVYILAVCGAILYAISSPQPETRQVTLEMSDEDVVRAIEQYATQSLGYARSVVTLHRDGGATVTGRERVR